MCVPDILHMRATARELNDATKYGRTVSIIRESRIRDQATRCCGEHLMMPKNNHKRNKLESTHQVGVFASVVPRTVEFVVFHSETINIGPLPKILREIEKSGGNWAVIAAIGSVEMPRVQVHCDSCAFMPPDPQKKVAMSGRWF